MVRPWINEVDEFEIDDDAMPDDADVEVAGSFSVPVVQTVVACLLSGNTDADS